jgi:hypothetical protein
MSLACHYVAVRVFDSYKWDQYVSVRGTYISVGIVILTFAKNESPSLMAYSFSETVN